MVRRQVCCHRLSNGGLGMPDLKNHWFAERLAYLGRSLSKDTLLRRKASETFLRHQVRPQSRRLTQAEGRSTVCLLMPSSNSQPSLVQWPFEAEKGTVSGFSGGHHFGSSRGSGRLVNGVGSLAFELGARFGLLEQFRVLAHLAACTESVALFGLNYKAGLPDMPDCPHCGGGLEQTADHAFYYWNEFIR